MISQLLRKYLLRLVLFFVLFSACRYSDGQTVLFTEDFESAAVPSSLLTVEYIGWLNYTVSGTNNRWWIFDGTRCDLISGSYSLGVSRNSPAIVSPMPKYNATSASENIAYYTTPINATNYFDCKLSFNWKCNGESSLDYSVICYSLNGITWNNFTNTGTYQGQTTTQVVTDLDISDIDGSQFYLGFRWQNDDIDAYYPSIIIDDIQVTGTSVTSMQYVSCTATQNNTTDVLQATTDQEIIGIEIVTTQPDNPLVVDQFRIRTDGSTDYANDISNMQVWYTGTSPVFATTSLFGSNPTIQPPGSNTYINGSQALAEGTNYFWVTYNIPIGASVGNVVDARFQRVRVDSDLKTPTVLEPSGNRTISAASAPNDDCADASELTVGYGSCSYTTHTNNDATSSGIANGSCGDDNVKDVWFYFTVPTSGNVTIETNDIDFTDGVMTVYSGTCGSLSEIDCDDDGGAALMPVLNLTGLTPASTIYIRFWEKTGSDFGNFEICVYEPSTDMEITTGFSADYLVQNVLVTGCLEAFNVTFTGNATGMGKFVNGDAVGFSEGIIIASGAATNADGPNNSGSISTSFGLAGDTDLDQLLAGSATSYDATVIAFDFIPSSDTVSFNFVFGSDEYLEYVDAGYNDAFGFFISGPGINGPYSNNAENIALLPDLTVVTIDNVNDEDHSEYYVDNGTGSTPDLNPDVQYDGFTTPLTASVIVQACETYHIKLAVADAGDTSLDSGVFLDANSFSSGGGIDLQIDNATGTVDSYEGCNSDIVFTRLDSSDTENAIDISFTVSGTATETDDYDPITSPVTIPAGDTSVAVPLSTVIDGLPEGTETIIIEATGGCPCTPVDLEDTVFLNDFIGISGGISNNDTTICEGGSLTIQTYISTGQGAYAYSWSPTGQTTANITPSPAVDTKYKVTVRDSCDNYFEDSVMVFVTPACTAPTGATADDNEICVGGSTNLNVAGGSLGVPGSDTWEWYSGSCGGTPEGDGNPLSVSPTTTTTYYVRAEGCNITSCQSVTVTVHPLPDVNFSGLNSDYCLEDATEILTGNKVPEGSFSGDGITDNGDGTADFDPSSAGVGGPYNITYSYTDGNGCFNSETQNVTVYDMPVATFSGLNAEYCVDASAATLTGNHAPDGTFSGSGITDNGDGTADFDPAVAGAGGPYNITYTYTDANTCEDEDIQQVNVNNLPTASFTGLDPEYCVDASPVTLSGNHLPDGAFSGTGITDNGDGTADFDPSSAGVGGPYSITYTYTDANGCSNYQTQNVTVNDLPSVSFSGLSAEYCVDASSATLTGNHAPDGTFSGNGITDNGDGTADFDPATAGSGGPYNITYTYTDVNGCDNSETQQVTINSLPTVSFSGLDDEYCEDEAVVLLTGNQAPDGSFSGQGITDNSNGTADFDPVSAGAGGPYSITYTYTDGNGCTNSQVQNVTINALPNISFSALPDICDNADPYTLTEGSPPGGSYSGPGVTGNTFDPAAAGTGTHVITYLFNDGTCSNSEPQNITVNGSPDADAGTDQEIPTGTSTALDGSASGGSGSYSYSWSPADSVDNPALEDPQTEILYTTNDFYVTVTDDITGCEDTSSVTITVTGGALSVVASGDPEEICYGDSTHLNAIPTGGSGSYTYTWASNPVGFSSTNKNPWASPLLSTVYFVTVNDGFTDATAQVTIIVNSLPDIDFPELSDVCIDASSFPLSGATPVGGIYSGTGVDGLGNFIPSTAGVGTHDITYTYTDGNGCTDDSTQTQTVNDLPAVTLDPLADVCLNDPAFAFTQGDPPGGTYSGGGISASPFFDPAVAGTGTHNITYSYTDINGCTNTDNEDITVNALPNVNFIGLSSGYCEDAVPATLTGNHAPNGSFSGTGITDNGDGTASFDPASAGPGGPYDITYSYTNANGCTNSETQQVNVYPLPDVSFTVLNAEYCVDALPVDLTGNHAPDGFFSGNGITDNGDGTAVFDPAAATVGGPYIVTYTYTDVNGCTNISTRNVSVNSLPTVSFTGLVNEYCADASSVTLTGNHAPGGTFSGNGITDNANGTATFDPSSVAAGNTYDIVYSYTNVNGCTNSDTQSVTINALPDVNFSGMETEYCLNALPDTLSGNFAPDGIFSGNGITDNGDGTAVFDPSDATSGGPYSISYSYTDINGCQNNDIQQVTVLALPDVSFTGLDPEYCANDDPVTLTGNHAIDLEGTFTGPGITDNGNGTALFNSEAAGEGGPYDITYTYTDEDNCTNSETQEVTINPLPDVSFTGLDSAYCVDDSEVMLSGNHIGAGSFAGAGITDNGDGTALFDPSDAGVGGPYNIIYSYTDANTCTNSDIQEVTVYDLPVVSFTGLDIGYCVDADPDTLTGNHAPDGTFSGNGITDNGDGTAVFDPIAANVGGPYSITYTYADTNTCDNTDIQTVMVYPKPTLYISDTTHVSCYGYDDGMAVATAVNGAPAYNYLWSIMATNDTVTGIPAGTYTVTVIDANTCTATTSVDITQPDSVILITSATNSNCGQADGSASVSVSGGTTPYSYIWNNGDTTDITDSLTAGIYTVTVTDEHFCIDSATVNISDEGAGTLSFSNITDNLCYGYAEGQATVNITGGTAPFTYLWSNGDTISTADSLPAGTHYVSVTDDNGCVSVSDTVISEPSVIVTGISDSVNINCYGFSNGSATITPSGGTPLDGYVYYYQWDDILSTTDSTVTGLEADMYYHVTVTDSNGCTVSDSVMLTQPTQLLSSITDSSGALCYGEASGGATVTPSGGAPLDGYIYYYQWDDMAATTDSTVTGLYAGIYYHVTITDNNGCIKTDSVIVSQPDSLILSGSSEDAICEGANGSAGVSVTGGTPPYSYQWNTIPVQTNDTATGLIAGTYTIYVTDSNECIDSLDIVIGYTSGGTAYPSWEDVNCYGDSTGMITVSMTGGTPDYNYILSDSTNIIADTISSDTMHIVNNLPAGTYYISVTDNNGCLSDTSVTVSQPDTILYDTIIVNNINCFGDSDGTAEVIASGGTPLYYYLWQQEQTDSLITGLGTGTYFITITDNNGCTVTDSAVISEPTQILISNIGTTDILCYGDSTGSAYAVTEGGSIPYYYLWSNQQTDSAATGLTAGEHHVTVTDINGCQTTGSFTLTQPDEIIVADSIFDGNNVEITVTGGTDPYAYSWSHGESTETVYGLISGIYMVTVTDYYDCPAYDTIEIAVLDIVIPTAFTPNDDGTNDTWQIRKIESYEKVSVEIFNRWGQVLYTYTGSGAGYNDTAWDGTYNGNPVALGSYVYILSLYDGNDPVTGTVSVVR